MKGCCFCKILQFTFIVQFLYFLLQRTLVFKKELRFTRRAAVPINGDSNYLGNYGAFSCSRYAGTDARVVIIMVEFLVCAKHN